MSPRSRDGLVGITTGYRLENGGVEVRVPVRHNVQTGPGVHSTSYTMGTGSVFFGDKAAGA
jgi:hypothetical protein